MPSIVTAASALPATRRPDRRVGALRTWFIAFAAITALGLAWVVSSPTLSGPDEAAHIIKAAAVVRGQFGGPETIIRQENERVQNIVLTKVDVPKGYAEILHSHECFAFYPESTAGCLSQISDDPTVVVAETYIGRYPPFYYAVVGWPSLLLAASPAALAMRVVSVLFAAAFLALGITMLVASDRSGLLTLSASLAITPMTMFLAATVNPSSLEIASAFALWAGSLALFTKVTSASRGRLGGVAIAGCTLCVVRPLGPMYALAIFAFAWIVAGSPERLRELRADRWTRRAALVLMIVLGLALAWIIGAKAYDQFAGNPVVGQSIPERAQTSLNEFVYRSRQMVGVFGWLDTPLNPGVIAGWYAMVAAMVVGALWVGRHRGRLALVLLLAALVVLPTVGEVLGAPPFGYVWQGRYSLPLALGVPLVAGWMLDRSPWAAALRSRVFLTASVSTIAFVAAAQLLGLVTSARRYSVGISKPMLSYLSAGDWAPPIGQTPTLVLSLVAVSVYAATLLTLVGGRFRHRRVVGDGRRLVD